ncbi:MAG TPA: NosD domain-containing protein [bacterium]|nr:NosD domain-containing protein [bacterium]
MQENKSLLLVLLAAFLMGFHFLFALPNQPMIAPGIFAENTESMINDLKISDDTGDAEQSAPALALNRYGSGIIAWEDQRGGESRILYQLVSNTGFLKGSNRDVWPALEGVVQRDPDVAIDDFGTFVVVWAEDQTGDMDIYFQIFKANLMPFNFYNPFRVNDDGSGREQYYPSIAMDSQGNFVICWTDYRNFTPAIYAQRYQADGRKIGENFLVNSDPSGVSYLPDIVSDEEGGFVIAWEQERTSPNYYIYARQYDSDGNALGDDFVVNLDPITSKTHKFASIALQKDGKMMIAYTVRDTKDVLYAHLYDSDGSSLIDYLEIPEWGGACNNNRPALAAHPNGGFTAVWSSDRNGTFDIFARNFTNTGTPVAASFRVSDMPGDQTAPALAIDDRRVAVAVWEDSRGTDKDIYAYAVVPLAPLNPTAGSGYRDLVPLSWDPIYAYSNIDVYKIYRSLTADGPYNLLATVDLSARGTNGRQMRDFIDTDVVNGTTYFYQISAVVSSVEGQRSTAVSATPSNAGHAIVSGWSSTMVRIDGEFSAGEWDDATVLDIANPGAGSPITLYVKNDADYLYFAIDNPNDEILETEDRMTWIFDKDNNKSWDADHPSDEGLIEINSGELFCGYWGDYPNDLHFDEPISASGVAQYAKRDEESYRWEAAFDLETSPLNVLPGSTIGLAIVLIDPSTFYSYHYGYAAEWPLGSLWSSAASLGELTLATCETPPTLLVPEDYATIVEAMTAADSGYTISVAAGTYHEYFLMKPGVKLLSRTGPLETIISSNGVNTLIKTAKDAVINGFTIADNYNGENKAGNGILSDGDNAIISNCIVQNNRIGIYLDNSSQAVISNNTIVANHGGIYMQINPAPKIFNNIICMNTESGINRNTAHSLGSPFLQYNDYFNNVIDFNFYGTAWTPEPGTGDLYSDPLFVGGTPADYHLAAGSPCIDAGDPISPLDPDGTLADMGALFTEQAVAVESEKADTPGALFLDPAYPNPFNPQTTLGFHLERAGVVMLSVFDLLGRQVAQLADRHFEPGYHQIEFDGSGLPSGIYLYRIKTADYCAVKKMILVE